MGPGGGLGRPARSREAFYALGLAVAGGLGFVDFAGTVAADQSWLSGARAWPFGPGARVVRFRAALAWPFAPFAELRCWNGSVGGGHRVVGLKVGESKVGGFDLTNASRGAISCENPADLENRINP